MARFPADPERALAGRRTARTEAHVHPQPGLPVDHQTSELVRLLTQIAGPGDATPVETGRRAGRHLVVELGIVGVRVIVRSRSRVRRSTAPVTGMPRLAWNPRTALVVIRP